MAAAVPSLGRQLVRRGAVAPFVAICLTAMLGVLALVADCGQLFVNRRHTQAAADAAAMAGATDLYQRWKTNSGLSDPDDKAKKSAISVAKSNGYEQGVNGATVTVTLGFASSPASEKSPATCTVVISSQQERFFSKIWGTSATTVTSRAVAAANYFPFNDGIIALNPTKNKALDANGNGSNMLIVKNAAILVNSNDDNDAASTVGNARIQDSLGTIQVNGGWTGTFQDTSGQTITPIHGPQVPDPLAHLPIPTATSPLPSTPGFTWRTSAGAWSGGLVAPVGATNITVATIYQPGTYSGNDMKFSGSENAFLMPGNYIISGNTGFSAAGSSSVTGEGVMIYANQLALTGNGRMTLSPPTSDTYQGVLYFQNRSSTATSTIAGNGTMNIQGTIYNRSGQFDTQGNGDVSVAGQIIADTIKNGGGAVANIVYDATNTAKMSCVRLVE